jgi:hypothetical protein
VFEIKTSLQEAGNSYMGYQQVCVFTQGNSRISKFMRQAILPNVHSTGENNERFLGKKWEKH